MADPTLHKLFADLLASHDRTAKLLADMEAALNKQPTTAQDANRLLQYFVAHWERHHGGEKMVVSGPQIMGSFKRLLATLDVEEVRVRIKRYFHTRDRWVLDARHAFPVFIARINELVPEGEAARVPVVGCTHDPRCSSEAEHTQRRAADNVAPFKARRA